MTTSKLNRAAIAFGTAGVFVAVLTAAMTPALGASSTARVSTYVATLRYIVGTNVVVPASSAGSNATQCPAGMYPVGGGPSSPSTAWTLQWSDPDRSSPSLAHPNEWTVGLLNFSSTSQVFKVFVVCSTAQKVTQNY